MQGHHLLGKEYNDGCTYPLEDHFLFFSLIDKIDTSLCALLQIASQDDILVEEIRFELLQLDLYRIFLNKSFVLERAAISVGLLRI